MAQHQAAHAYDERAGPLGRAVNFPESAPPMDPNVVAAAQAEAGSEVRIPKRMTAFKGIVWCHDSKKWTAHIMIDGSTVPLGSFDMEEEVS